MIVYAKILRSKKSGWFFKFEQYFDDGYGKYHDIVSADEICLYASMPDIFKSNDNVVERKKYQFENHDISEIEEVPIEICINGVEP